MGDIKTMTFDYKTCYFCNTAYSVESKIAKVTFLKRKTPPLGAADLNIYSEESRTFSISYGLCPTCGYQWVSESETPFSSGEGRPNFNQKLHNWIKKWTKIMKYDSYKISESNFEGFASGDEGIAFPWWKKLF